MTVLKSDLEDAVTACKMITEEMTHVAESLESNGGGGSRQTFDEGMAAGQLAIAKQYAKRLEDALKGV